MVFKIRNFMKKLLTQLTQSYRITYLFLIFVTGIGLIYLVFPSETRFKYEFQKGSPWQHQTLIAPFDFAILKSSDELAAEKDSVMRTYVPYFVLDTLVENEKVDAFDRTIDKLTASDPMLNLAGLKSKLSDLLHALYQSGILPQSIDSYDELAGKSQINQINGKLVTQIPTAKLHSIKTAYQSFNDSIRRLTGKYFPNVEQKINLNDFIAENLNYDKPLNIEVKKQLLEKLSTTRGMVQAGERIISEGDLISPQTHLILESLKKAYEKKKGNQMEHFLEMTGRLILITTFMVLMFLYLLFYRRELFEHRRKMLFIIFMMVLMIFLAGLSTKIKLLNIYVIPVAILPVMIRIFFDSRTAIFSLMVTTLIIGYFAPNSYEYIILQMVAGVIAVFTLNKLHKRSHLVISAFAVFLSYSIVYIAMALVQESSFKTIDWRALEWFGLSSILIFITYPLIYIFEKVFGFVSDVTLIELANTNHPLLRKLAEEAPGTFQHSLQVANLAEAVVFRIGGNPFLIYAGALYHDIGKTKQSEFFIENQAAGMNPHDHIDHQKSAEIIIDHVKYGVQLARKYKLPEILISFITTHHGTSQANYFYKMYQNENPGAKVDPEKFSYPGPLPFSKETAVLMLTDGIEAAARSLKEKSVEKLREMIDNMVEQKIRSGQLIDADLTFRDITILKNTLLEKLTNIYHARIEYPK
jgi:hypothetical protein